MLDLINQALTWISDIIDAGVSSIIGFFFYNFPQVGATGQYYLQLRRMITGIYNTDFFTWFDWNIIYLAVDYCSTIWFCLFAFCIAKLIINIIHAVMDSIPIIG